MLAPDVNRAEPVQSKKSPERRMRHKDTDENSERSRCLCEDVKLRCDSMVILMESDK